MRRKKPALPTQLLNQVRARERREMEDKKQGPVRTPSGASFLEDIIDRGMQTFLEEGQALE